MFTTICFFLLVFSLFMMFFIDKLLFYAALIAHLFWTIRCFDIDDAQTCDTKSPCVCMYPNNFALDLTQLSIRTILPSNFSTASNTSHVYFYSPCLDKALNLSDPTTGVLWVFEIAPANVSTTPLDPNGVLNNSIPGNLTLLGKTEMSQFKNTGFRLNTATIQYTKDTELSEVKLDCVRGGENSLHIFPPSHPPVAHSLLLSGPNACPNEVESKSKHHLSTGSVMVILFFTFGLIYLGGGCLINKYLRGAQGPELIPNHDFWFELPSLVKDGVMFALSCGRTPQNTYESI